MTYSIGDRTVDLDEKKLTESDKELILAHRKLFKYCLNQITYKFILNLKNVLHLYSDIITIYSLLLEKVPHYDDVTNMTLQTKQHILKIEEDLIRIFGPYNPKSLNKVSDWHEKSYEKHIKHLTVLILESCQEGFEVLLKNLNCIDIFFSNFSNLKNLKIPLLLNQSKIFQRSITKSLYLFKLNTIADDIDNIKQLTPPIIKQLQRVEKISNGIARESTLLNSGFVAFDKLLQQYTYILLGKAILKREINDDECQMIKRRDVCFQAAEHVVSIVLTDDQNNGFSRQLAQNVAYILVVLAVITSIMIDRLFKVFS